MGLLRQGGQPSGVMHILYTAPGAAGFQKIIETIGRRPKSERRNRAGGEKHHGRAKTKTQPKA
jgi:hypothetical protein